MARCAWPALYLAVLSVLAAPFALPAHAAPGNGPRVRELAGAAVHPWRLEIHRPPQATQPTELERPETLPDALPVPPLPVAAASRDVSERTFAQLRELGIRHARVDLLWCQVEPSQGAEPDWSMFDSVIASAQYYGIDLTPVVLCVPGWANGNRHYFTYPTDPADFARFFARALARYPQIEAWEIWNEPNHPYFARPEPRVAPFVAMLRAANRARASTGSRAKLISGGLAASNGATTGLFTFFERMADAGALDLIDGLGVHPYSKRMPDQIRSTFMRLSALHRRLVERGRPDIPLWLTEYAVPDSARPSGYGQAGDEAHQADALRKAYAIAARWPWVARVTWYEARDNCDDAADPECRLGLMRPGFALKKSGTALRALLAGGPFPLLRSTTIARVRRQVTPSELQPRAIARSPAYSVTGSVFAPGDELSGRRVVIRVAPLRKHAGQSRPRKRSAVLTMGAYSVSVGRLRPGRYRVRVAYRGDAYHARSLAERILHVPGRPRTGGRARR
jgi:hypothetical protein